MMNVVFICVTLVYIDEFQIKTCNLKYMDDFSENFKIP